MPPASAAATSGWSSYFGEVYSKDDCGACDYCLGELETVSDPVTLARKILSCVARVGQRFGAAHVGSVLRGHASEQVKTRGHDTLSVFGLLKDTSIDEMRGYIDQLIAHGLLQQAGDQYPVLQLSADGAALLKDPAASSGLSLARQRKPEKGRAPRRSRVEAESWEGVDRELFESLRELRLRVARERGVPPYVIFHDTTLRELARQKPQTVEALRHVYGVGAQEGGGPGRPGARDDSGGRRLGSRLWALAHRLPTADCRLPAAGLPAAGCRRLVSMSTPLSGLDGFDWTTAFIADACVQLQLPVRLGRPGCCLFGRSSARPGRWRRRFTPAAPMCSSKPSPRPCAATCWSSTTTGGSTKRCIGDLVAGEAHISGLAAIVVDGAHRDSAAIRAIGIPVWSRGTAPNGPLELRRRHVTALEAATCGPTTVTREDAVFADEDGVLFVALADCPRVIAAAREIATRELAQAAQLLAGDPLRDQLRLADYVQRRAEDPEYTFREHVTRLKAAIEV